MPSPCRCDKDAGKEGNSAGVERRRGLDVPEVQAMRHSLTLPDELFNKLARGAAQRGLTMEGLLAFVSEFIMMPDRPTERDRQRSHRIERLLAKYRTGRLTEQDRADL